MVGGFDPGLRLEKIVLCLGMWPKEIDHGREYIGQRITYRVRMDNLNVV